MKNLAGSQLSEGKEFFSRISDWISANGPEMLANAIAAALIFVAGMFAIKLLDLAVRKALARKKRKKLLADFIASAITKSCWAVLAVTVLGKLGVNVAPLIAGLGVTGFIIGFAFQESLGNLAAGLMVAINQPFKPGDFIDAAGLQGSVVEVNMMATVLATPDNKRITIPNKSVWGGPITNFSAMATRRVDMQVGIAYGADIEKALEIIKKTVISVPGVLAQPAPAVSTGDLSESQVTINVRPWSANADYWAVRSAALAGIKKALGEAGIEIPFPQITVHKAES